MSEKKKVQFLFLVVYEFIAGFLALALDLNALWYLGISWFVPTLFLLYKLHINRYSYILEALLWSIPGSLLIDWIGHYTKAWSFWGNPLFASTGIKILSIPLESFVWGTLHWIFYVVIYEYFFDENRSSNFNNKEKLLIAGFTIASLALVVSISLYQPVIPFFYLLILLVFIFTTIISLSPYRKLIPRVIKFGLLVFIFGLQVEFFSLELGLWLFPEGDFIKEISFLGYFVPIEEIAWWLVVPTGIAAVHEVFADNHR